VSGLGLLDHLMEKKADLMEKKVDLALVTGVAVEPSDGNISPRTTCIHPSISLIRPKIANEG
jgi:hypothetical protein